jgi:hypothetical protein
MQHWHIAFHAIGDSQDMCFGTAERVNHAASIAI